MMASIPAYNTYAEEVIMPGLDQEALAEIKRMEAAGETEDPAYEELLMEHHYVTTCAGCRRRVARPGAPRLRPHQP